MEYLATIRSQLTEFFGKMERAQIIRLALLVALIIIVSVAAVLIINYKEYDVLPVSADAAKMGEVNARLDELQVKKRIGEDGTILVPKDQVDSLTWQLASEGLFDNDFNYEWIQQGTGITSTESTQAAYETIQIAENLSRTLTSFAKIRDARVNLNIVEESPFVYSGVRQQSTAAVMLLLADNENPLTAQEARTVRELVKMWHNFDDEHITIVDNMFNYYDETTALAEPEISATDRLTLQYKVQDDLSRSLTKFFEPVFGIGRVLVRVAAELNFDTETVQSIAFAPPVDGMETGLPISLHELSEMINGGEGAAQGEPGLDENGGAISYVEEALLGDGSVYQKTEREVNMEINETKTLIERAEGVVESLSVSVLIPLDEEMDDYTSIVREMAAGAAGIVPDSVTVGRLPVQDEASPLYSMYENIEASAQQYQLIRLIIIIVAIILVVVLLLLALRTVLRALRPPQEAAQDAAAMEQTAPDMTVVETESGDFVPVETPISQVQRYIERDPESVAQLLRNWLTDDYR